MASAISSLETTPFDRVLYLDTKSDKTRKKNFRKCSSDVCKRSSAFLPLAQLTRVKEIFQVVVDSSQPKKLLAQTFSLRITHQTLGVWCCKCFGVLCDLVCSGLQIFQQKNFLFHLYNFNFLCRMRRRWKRCLQTSRRWRQRREFLKKPSIHSMKILPRKLLMVKIFII